MAPTDRWLVVGLGNPGPAYAGNRHNVGAMVLDELAAPRQCEPRSRRNGAARSRPRAGSACCPAARPAAGRSSRARVVHERVRRPGRPRLPSFYKVAAERLVVVHDELDIPFGDVRLKRGGGEGGHNGLRSISQVAGHQGLPAGAGRHRPAARAGWTRPPSS